MERTLKVTAIEVALLNRQRPGGGTEYINLIHFLQPNGEVYTAEEPMAQPTSNFQVNEMNTFKVTSPGRDGRRDWVRFIGVGNNVVVNREKLHVAVSCMTKAYEIGIPMGMGEDEIREMATRMGQFTFNLLERL